MSASDTPSFDERLRAFLMTELCGLLQAHANEQAALEREVEEILYLEHLEAVGGW